MNKIPKTITLTDENFEIEVLGSAKPVLVEIGADWSGGCHIMSPILDELAFIYEEQIKFGKVDIQTNEKLANNYGVTDLPILLLFKNGDLRDHVIGTISKKELETRLKSLL